MDDNSTFSNNIWVKTVESVDIRGDQYQQLNVDQLSVNVNVFLEQMSSILKETPSTLGNFQFVEFEISAEISAEGQIVLLGSGGKIGATGGLKFLFRRASSIE